MPAASRMVVDQAVYDERSLRIPEGFGWDDWLREVQDIQWRHRSMLWWLGDSMVFGERRFGEIYTQVVEDYSEESIMRAMPVCKEFPIERRRPIGFSFHQAVMAKDRSGNKRIFTAVEADALLDQAVDKKMTREAFRELIAERKKAFIEAEHERQREIFAAAKAEPELKSDSFLQELKSEEPAPRMDAPPAAEVVNLFPTSEQQQVPALSADDAADRLMSVARAGQLPEDIIEAILIVLQDRDRLIAEVGLRAGAEQA